MSWFFYFFALNIFNPAAAPLDARLGPFGSELQCIQAKAELHTGLSKLAGSGWQLWTIPIDPNRCWSGPEEPVPPARTPTHR